MLAVAVTVALGPMLLVTPVAQASTCTLATIPSGSGTPGTSGNPYAVSSADDLKKVGVGHCSLSAHYRQISDIELPAPTPGSSNHVPIGTSLDRFRGIYDGAGHVISGLVVDSPTSADPVGLFGSVAGATISAVRLTDAAVEGDVDVGALIGYAAGSTLSDIVVSGAVVGRYKVGGLVGRALETSGLRVDISDVATDVDVTARSHPDPSGSDNVQQIGGLIGEAIGVDIARSTSAGPVIATADGYITRIGGLVGSLNDGTIARSAASGDVDATAVSTVQMVGGLVGSTDGLVTIRSSFASGDVTASGSATRYVGGLLGQADDSSLQDVSSSGDVSGDRDVGGLIGGFRVASVADAVAVGRVTGSSPDVGGLVGGFGGDFDAGEGDGLFDAFWDTSMGRAADPAEQYASDGLTVQGLPSADLQTFATYASAGWRIVNGWAVYDVDVGRVWGICDGASYPFLLWRFTSDPCVGGSGSPSTGPVPAASDGDASAVTVRVASAQAAAIGVAGSASGVRVREGMVLPVTVGLSGSVGPRGGVVLESGGRQVRVASVLGARADAGVMVPTDGVFEASVSGGLVPGSVIEVWINSAPRLVAAAAVPADGGPVTVAIPTGAPLDGGGPVVDGAHTLELRMFTTDGFEVVAMGITVGQVMPTGVPAGEGPLPSPAGVGLLALLALLGGVAAAMRVLRGRSVSR